MRATPTVTPYSPNSGTSGKGYDAQNSVDVTCSIGNQSEKSFLWQMVSGSAATVLEFHHTRDARL
jgi:hypothetical protein